jgi:hypothetical protein
LAHVLQEQYSTYGNYEFKERLFRGMVDMVFETIRADGFTFWQYLMLHTHMRPRDLIVLCEKCRSVASGHGKAKIGGFSLNLGVFEYSRFRYAELVASNRWYITNFKGLIDSFMAKPVRLVFNKAKLSEHLRRLMLPDAKLRVMDVRYPHASIDDSVELMIETLFLIGFIVQPGDKERLFTGHYVNPYVSSSSQDVWMVHPAYFRALSGQEVDVRQVVDMAIAECNQDRKS